MKLTGVLAALATGIVFATPLIAGADGDRCTNIRFKFTNSHATERVIQVTGVEYEDLVNNKKVTRKLSPIECAYRATCLTGAEDLGDVDGNNIGNIRLVYKYRDHDNGWSTDTRSSTFDSRDNECRDDRVYGPGARGFVRGFVISGATP